MLAQDATTPSTSHSERRFELDWLRVLAILAVFFLHSLRFFDTETWHVKNFRTYPEMALAAMFFVTWIMPLIFVISGASSFYAIRKYPPATFLRERALRLLVPLLVGIFTHAAWQVYLEKLTYQRFQGSFLAFYPRYFNGLYGFGGNFAWMGLHLWYLEILFLYSVITLPLLAWLVRGRGKGALAWFGARLAFPGGAYLMAVPLILAAVLPDPRSTLGSEMFGGWSVIFYLAIFLAGFAIISHPGLYDSVRRLRWVSLALATALSAYLILTVAREGAPFPGGERWLYLASLRAVDSWLLILAIVGLAAGYLRKPARWLFYANEAVLPFYILHQTVLLSVGFPIMRTQMPDPLKWALTTGLSLATCLLLYEFGIRRWNVMRFLFGMRPLPPKPLAAPVPATGVVGSSD